VDQADPGAVDLHGQGVDGCGDLSEAVVVGAPELGGELGQLFGHGGQEPGRALFHHVFEHVSSVAVTTDKPKAHGYEYRCK
jgi:hypothetical protein